MSLFNPMATSSKFETTFFTIPEGTHRFKITGTKLRKQKWGDGEAFLVDVQTRVENGNSDTNGKMVNITCQIGMVAPDGSGWTVDDEGNPMVDFKKVAEIFHAAFGYANNSKSEDERFMRERDGLDLTVDPINLALTGSGWDELKDCSIMATVTHRQDKKDPNKVYPDFKYISPVGK